MPRLSCWFIRAALLYLAVGATLGALILIHKGSPLHPLVWRLLPAHVEFLLFGWTVQLVMGVVFWIFPRFWRSRGSEKPVWLAFVLLNIGIWLVGVGPTLGAEWWALPGGRIAQAGAVVAFALNAWSRVKAPGAQTPTKTGS